MNHFKGHSSVVFGTFTTLCIHHLYQVQDIFVTPEGSPVPTLQPLPISPSPNLWEPLVCCLSMGLLILDVSYRWNHPSFCNWFLHLACFHGASALKRVSALRSFFMGSGNKSNIHNTLLYGNTMFYFSIYKLMSMWAVSTLGLL